MDFISRRMGLVVLAVLGASAIGCGGSSAKLSGGSATPAAPPAAEAQPGYGAPIAASKSGDSAGQMEAPSAAPSPAPAEASAGAGADVARRRDVAPQPEARPGLGTEWGETRSSRISTVSFVRADAQNPFATTTLFYNDEQGARAMANASGFRRTGSGVFNVGSGAVQIGLRDESGNFLTGFVAGERNYAVGEAGQRYTIVVRNRTDARFECVLSVDGLDVLDGKSASFGKRGYLVDAHGELEVDGFRQSTEAVAAFRFGSVRDSYANQKHGDTRNVGVIGLALFNERGSNPFPWTQDEIDRRHDANPFPGQFATPPGR